MSLRVEDTPESAAPSHVDDGDLVRFEDAELDTSDRARVMTHLDACAQCSDRRAAFVAAGARLHAASRHLQIPAALAVPPWHGASGNTPSGAVRRRARRPTWLAPRAFGTGVRGAAALALLATAAAAATPVRQWISVHVRRPSPAVSPSAVERPRATPTPEAVVSHTVSLSFVPTSEVLTIGLDARSGDSIEVRPTRSESVHVRASSTGGEPTLAVKPDRLELVSADSGVTIYAVEVPPTVRVVDVRNPSRLLVHLTRASLDARGGWRRAVP